MSAQEATTVASERVLRLIDVKRSGAVMSAADITALVADIVSGAVPDYQSAAWLATVACTGMEPDELTALTMAYVNSGETLSLNAGPRRVADKHSTGGVGDKTTLVVAPVVAACGIAVGKVSGRGLGFMGGTVDKLESIPGLDMELSASAFRELVTATGIAITGQSSSLVPGDQATYALRDVTGTVDSLPLIAASIMSKKVASGCDSVVLDVKFGGGAVLPSLERAMALARTMIDLGNAVGLPTTAVLSRMDQPLGYAIGNVLEVREALDVLRGRHVPGLSELVRTISSLMISSADPTIQEEKAAARVDEVLADGSALAMFRSFVEHQGGNTVYVDNPDAFEVAAFQTMVEAPTSGYVTAVSARGLGEIALRIGAGRTTHAAPLDRSAGIVLGVRVGDPVRAGEPLATVHGANDAQLREVSSLVRDCFRISAERPTTTSIVEQVLRPSSVRSAHA
jgi:pyrimidine-nucleoside phosphorylase